MKLDSTKPAFVIKMNKTMAIGKSPNSLDYIDPISNPFNILICHIILLIFLLIIVFIYFNKQQLKSVLPHLEHNVPTSILVAPPLLCVYY